MTILHSCCFWKSVRKGSYASAIYTLVYFSCSSIIVSTYLYDERKYLIGEVDKPSGESFLEKEAISPTTVIFNILLLICASCGIVSSFLVIIALKKDQRELLIPWILSIISDLIIECSHFTYLLIIRTLDFEPLTATLFTIDFFFICLNTYCLLCVISQYQEYKAGRGYARDENQPSEISLHNSPSPSVVHMKKFSNQSVKNNHQRTTTPTPTTAHSHLNFTKIVGTTPSPENLQVTLVKRQTDLLKRKHVQFPDDEHSTFNVESKTKLKNNRDKGENVLIDMVTDNQISLSWNQLQQKDGNQCL